MKNIVIGRSEFPQDMIEQVVKAADIYLTELPPHGNGFCAWAAYVQFVAGAHRLVDAVRVHWAGHGGPEGTYVDRISGPTPTRLLFVRQLRDYLVGVLALRDSTGPAPADTPPTDVDSYLGTCNSPLVPEKPQAPSAKRPPAWVVPVGTQAHRVLQALQDGETSLTGIATFARCQETAASARIRELRSRYGRNIETRRAPGKAQRFTYHIIGA